MVSMAVLIRTFSSGIHTYPVSWNCAYHLRMDLSDGGCFPNLMRNYRWTIVPRQSFWITLYFITTVRSGSRKTINYKYIQYLVRISEGNPQHVTSSVSVILNFSYSSRFWKHEERDIYAQTLGVDGTIALCWVAEQQDGTVRTVLYGLDQCFSTVGPRPCTGTWHQLYRVLLEFAI